jgi:hypothetical protein
MNTTLKVATILSWINIVTGSFLVLIYLLGMLAMPNVMILIFAVITGSIILHAYATLQLRKSIINPAVPLSSQTPTGIRFIGFIALFFAMLSLGNAVVMIQKAEEVIKMANLPYVPKGINMVSLLQAFGVIFLLFSIGIAVNVFLSTRLLRWYLMNKEE